MPIYDYVCSNCRHRAEVLHGVHDEGARTCAECGGQMRKAISAPAIVFKGSGWAKVDRRTSRPTRTDAGEGTGEAAAAAVGASSDAGSDDKGGKTDKGGKGGDGAEGRKATKDAAPSTGSGSSEGSGTGPSSGSGTKPKATSSGD